MHPLVAADRLTESLADRMSAIMRVGATLPHRQKSRLGDVLEQARCAIADGEAPVLQAALMSIDLLALELCEEEPSRSSLRYEALHLRP